MAFSDRLDPPKVFAAATTGGKLVAQGILEPRDLFPGLLLLASRGGYRGDLIGLQARLHWQIADTADHWHRLRDRTEFQIRRELQPMIDAWADADDIMKEADALNNRQGAPLLWVEVVAVVEDCLTAALRRNARTQRRRYVR